MADNSRHYDRRSVLRTLGTLPVAGAVGVGTVSARPSPSLVRLQGSRGSPISQAEINEKVDAARGDVREDGRRARATPEFSPGQELVEFVLYRDRKGRLRSYYGAAAQGHEDAARRRAEEQARDYKRLGKRQITTHSMSVGEDWNPIWNKQAHETADWGELNHNFEWYASWDDGREHNVFRTKAASSDDTTFPYSRFIDVTHDYSVNEQSNRDIHEAEPSSGGSGGSTTVGVGIPPQLSMSWTFDSSGSMSQNLTNSGPKVEWVNEFGGDSTVWFHPGSHLVTDYADCTSGGNKDVVKLRSKARWGGNEPLTVYELYHYWNLWWDC